MNTNFCHCCRGSVKPPRKGPHGLVRWALAFGAAVLLIPSSRTAAPAQNVKPASAGNADTGKRLFASAGCATCHNPLAKGMNGLGPQITPPRLAIPEFINFVRQPSGMMRAFTQDDLSDAQLGDIYAYLQSLSSATGAPNLTGNAKNGKELFTNDGCYECHGTQGQGGVAGPRIGPNPIPFPNFSIYVRKPAGEMPPFTTKVVSDQELSDIYSYLQSLPPPRKDVKSIPSVK